MDGPGDGQSVTQDTRQKKNAPFGPFGLFGSCTSFPFPRPFFFPSFPALPSFLDFLDGLPGRSSSGLRLLFLFVRGW
jgi:hypothetical protein